MSTDTFLSLQLYALSCSMVGFGLSRTMEGEKDIFGFIPQFIENKFGVDSLLYRLISCPVCLSGQVAFWAGFFVFKSGQYPVIFIVSGAFVALFWAAVLEKWFNKIR